MGLFDIIFNFAKNTKSTAQTVADATRQFDEGVDRLEQHAIAGAQTAERTARRMDQTSQNISRHVAETTQRANSLGRQAGAMMGEFERGVNEINGMVKHETSKIPPRQFSPAVARLIEQRKAERERGL